MDHEWPISVIYDILYIFSATLMHPFRREKNVALDNVATKRVPVKNNAL